MEKKLEKYGQHKLLSHIKNINEIDRQILMSDIEKIDFEELNNLFLNVDKLVDENILEKNLDFLEPINKSIRYDKLKSISYGKKILENAQLSILIMAAGEGTRLKHNGPKGTYEIDFKNFSKSIFEIHFDNINKASKKYNVKYHVIITTSEKNNDLIINFFEKNNYFLYDKNYIHFVKQEMIASIDYEGNLLLEEKNKIYFSPNGNGDIAKILLKNNIYNKIGDSVKYLFVCNIDNILTNHFDEEFIGATVLENSEFGAKIVKKMDSEEKIGLFVKYDNSIKVIEYSEMPKKLLNLKNENNELVYSNGNIANYLFKIDVLKNVSNEKLNYHVAKKIVNYFEKDNIVIPDKENCYKFEKFILDIFKYFDNIIVFEVDRESEFAPIKNLEGDSSVITAKKLYENYHKLI